MVTPRLVPVRVAQIGFIVPLDSRVIPVAAVLVQAVVRWVVLWTLFVTLLAVSGIKLPAPMTASMGMSNVLYRWIKWEVPVM